MSAEQQQKLEEVDDSKSRIPSLQETAARTIAQDMSDDQFIEWIVRERRDDPEFIRKVLFELKPNLSVLMRRDYFVDRGETFRHNQTSSCAGMWIGVRGSLPKDLHTVDYITNFDGMYGPARVEIGTKGTVDVNDWSSNPFEEPIYDNHEQLMERNAKRKREMEADVNNFVSKGIEISDNSAKCFCVLHHNACEEDVAHSLPRNW